ncbi:translocation/assembly module TamB domain-containing protein, partial [Leptolyngbya sp. FACHB-36]|uniref:translocation/assembly module TamB domain-containing protein n=1 Tax=Leptolyngbya sp. FACHB-36 TaxID=2692808 RepID=UPI0016806FD1
DVAGQRDRIAVTLDSAYRPVAFDIRRDTAVARGRRQGGLLLVQAQRFPLELLNGLTPVALLFPFGGELSGNVALNLERQQATGDIAIANPQVGNFLADRFGGRIDFRNGVATLSGAELRRGQSVFQINGSASIQGRDPKFQGQILANGNLQDVLGLAQVFELEDLQRGLLQPPAYGSAADLQTAPAGQSRASVLTQLRRLSEIEALRAQADARRQESPLPELRELQGNFNSSVTIAGSLQTGVRANFDLRGQNWKWGPNFSADQVVAQGNFQDGVLTLLPLRFQTNDAVVAFSGQVGGAQQSGQLRVANVPIDQLTDLLNLPLNVEGKLNATATLAGSLNNPQAIGDISVSDGTLNGTELEQAQGSFRYANARLDFGSTILIDGPEPISVAGSVPRQLPFATVAPDSDQISLDINVKNEGLALLNLLNNQVAWVDGQGRVNVQVRGTLTQPIATGIAEVQNATLQAKALPEPLTGVTGAIRFDRDRLRVDSVQGQFSQGNLSASGVIPIFASLSSTDPDQATPLSVALNRIRLTLKGIYQGGVEGNVQVAGTALNPVLGGVIRLSDGQVLLSESAGGAVTSPTTTGTTPTGAGQPAGSNSNVSFNNLLLQLGDRVRVTRQPIINFLA